MKEIFYKLIEEAKNGVVLIDNDSWPVGWNTIIYNGDKIKYQNIEDNSFPTLVIKNEEESFLELKKYLELELEKKRKIINFVNNKEENQMKLLMTYLFVNATTEDFLNPVYYIRRYREFLNDDTFSYLEDGKCIKLSGVLNCDLEIKNQSQSVFMETPNRLEIAFVKEEDGEKISYNLPNISYGININNGEKECYIYSMLNKKDSNNDSSVNEKFVKDISRKLYKLNKNVLDQESREYLDYKNGVSDYYPENISDVSPSFVMALVIFLSLLKKQGITRVKGVPYLPVRYLSRNIAANSINDANKMNKLKERNDLIQTNITNKFIRTIRRAVYHLDGVEIISYPYEYDEFINIRIVNDKTNTNNELLNEVMEGLNKKQK